jgi:hypothetical protein
MSAKIRRFVPRLECFDERAMPSVTYAYDPNLQQLTITGDAVAGDNLTINDDGTAAGITVTSGDGHNWPNATETGGIVAQVFVKTQGGNDIVNYNLNAPLTVFRLVDVDLGLGADKYTANISNMSLAAPTPPNTQPVNLDLSAHGGGGGDSMILNATNFSTASGSVLNVDFSGDAGKDVIQFNYSIGLDGQNGIVSFKKDQKH